MKSSKEDEVVLTSEEEEEEEEERKKKEKGKDYSQFSVSNGSSSGGTGGPSAPVQSSVPSGGGGGVCDGDVCTFDPSRFDSGGPTTDAGPSDFFGSAPPSSSASQPANFGSGGGGGGCDGDVCTFDPSRFDSPSSVDSTVSETPATEAWNPFEDKGRPQMDPVRDCVNDACTQVVQEQVSNPEDCEGIGGTCEKTESFNIRLMKVVTSTKLSLISQLLIFHFSFLNSLNRQFAEHLVYFDERYRNIKQFLRDIIYRSISSSLFLIFIKLCYDIFVESMVQFCCGGPVKNIIPRLDRIMSVVTIYSSMRHCQSDGKFFCFLRGVKDVLKTLMIVYFSGIVGAFLSTFLIHGIERLITIVHTKFFVKNENDDDDKKTK